MSIVCEIKAMPPQEFKVDLDEGTFEGYCAAYGNIDQGGDRLLPGAGKHIAEANPTLPIYFGHGWMQNERPVGKSLYFDDQEPGLFTKGKIFDVPNNADILMGMREGVLGGISIGWRPVTKRMVKENGRTIREVLKYDLQEYSILPNGFAMNPRALVTAVKSGRVLIMADDGIETDPVDPDTKVDLTDMNILPRTYEGVDQSDPVAVFLDEASYLKQLTENLKAEGREDEIREALVELEAAALILKGRCAVQDIELPSGDDDLLDHIRNLTTNIREASLALIS